MKRKCIFFGFLLLFFPLFAEEICFLKHQGLDFEETYKDIYSAMILKKEVEPFIYNYVLSHESFFDINTVRYNTIARNQDVAVMEYIQFLDSYIKEDYVRSSEHLYLSIYLFSKSWFENDISLQDNYLHSFYFRRILRKNGIEDLYEKILEGSRIGFLNISENETDYKPRSDFDNQIMSIFFGDAQEEELSNLIDMSDGLHRFSFFRPIGKQVLIQYNPNNREAVSFIKRLEEESQVILVTQPTRTVHTVRIVIIADSNRAREIYTKYYGNVKDQ